MTCVWVTSFMLAQARHWEAAPQWDKRAILASDAEYATTLRLGIEPLSEWEPSSQNPLPTTRGLSVFRPGIFSRSRHGKSEIEIDEFRGVRKAQNGEGHHAFQFLGLRLWIFAPHTDRLLRFQIGSLTGARQGLARHHVTRLLCVVERCLSARASLRCRRQLLCSATHFHATSRQKQDADHNGRDLRQSR